MLVSLRAAVLPIIAAMVAAIAAEMTAHGLEAGLLATVIATLGVTSIVTGLVLGLLGHFGLGRFVRYFPYPVMAGLLAGTGVHLVTGGLSITADRPLAWADISAWSSPETLQLWDSAMMFGVTLHVIQRRWHQWFVVPVVMLLGLATFHAIVWSSGLILEEVAASGWLPQFSTYPVSLTSVDLGDLSSVHWPTVTAQAGSIAAVAVLCTILLLTDVAGIEIVANREIEPNRELKVAGAANAACGLVGGCPGVQALMDTAMVASVGGDRRLMGCVRVGCLALAVIAGASFLSVFPKFLLGGFLVSVGLDFLRRWAWEIRRELPATDYLVVLLILLVCVWQGILLGMLFGVVMSVVLFVITYSRLSSIKSEFTGRDHASHIERGPEIRKLLDREGDCIVILRLQGAIFFGTAGDLMGDIRDRLESGDGSRLKYLVLDFKHVTFLDASGARSFSRLAQLTENHGVSVVVTGHGSRIRRQLEGNGFFTAPEAVGPVRRIQFSQLDEGVAWSENRILDVLGISQANVVGSLEDWLADLLEDEDAARSMAPFFERQEYAAGDWLFRQGGAGRQSLCGRSRYDIGVDRDSGWRSARCARLYSRRGTRRDGSLHGRNTDGEPAN